MRKTFVQTYLTEPVMFGGEVSSRGKIIVYLKSIGATQAMTDRYLQGLDQGKAIRSKTTATKL